MSVVTRRLRRWSPGIAIAAAVWLQGPAQAGPEQQCAQRVTIVHTNDLKGRLSPGPYFDEMRGGMVRLVPLLQSLTAGGDVLLVDGGDALGPDPMAHFDAGRLFLSLMGRAGYSAMVPGNHDVNYGPDSLRVRASESGFPFLAANLRYGPEESAIVDTSVIVRVGDARVLLTGLLSPGIQQSVNPVRTMGLTITDPHAALARVVERSQVSGDVDLMVVLVHMPPDEVMALARDFPQVDLFIAGDNEQADKKGSSIHLIELASDTRIASTPGNGSAVGKIVVDLATGESEPSVVWVSAELIPVDSTLAVDEHVAGLIDIHEKAFAHSRSAEIGHIEREISDTPAFVAAVLRRRLRTEVAMINLGALRPVTLSHRVRQSQIDSLMRFDDPLMELRITGADLTRLASESSQRTDDKEQLVFSGYDPHAKTVRHVPIEDDEEYSLATTAFLGTGGDRYFEAGSVDVIQTYQNITLKDAVAEHVRQFGDPLGELEKLARKGSSWKTRTKVSNSLTRTSLNRAAGRYQAVSIISGRDAMAWSTLISSRGSRRTRRGSLVVDVKSSFGQVREEGRFREALDRLDVDAAYTWRGGQPAPFAAAAVSTVWTAPSGQDRPLTLRGSAGLQMRLADHAGVRFGLGLERDMVTNSSQVGLEAVPEYRLNLGRGNSFASSTKVFVGATQSRKISIQRFNSLLVNLSGGLHAAVDANLFYFWDNVERSGGIKSELQVGLGYVWDGKRAR